MLHSLNRLSITGRGLGNILLKTFPSKLIRLAVCSIFVLFAMLYSAFVLFLIFIVIFQNIRFEFFYLATLFRRYFPTLTTLLPSSLL